MACRTRARDRRRRRQRQLHSPMFYDRTNEVPKREPSRGCSRWRTPPSRPTSALSGGDSVVAVIDRHRGARSARRPRVRSEPDFVADLEGLPPARGPLKGPSGRTERRPDRPSCPELRRRRHPRPPNPADGVLTACGRCTPATAIGGESDPRRADLRAARPGVLAQVGAHRPRPRSGAEAAADYCGRR